MTGGSSLGGGGEVSKPDNDSNSDIAIPLLMSAMDWRLLARCCSSSSSSAISPSLRRRIELVEDEVDPEAAWREQAADNFVSLSSLAVVMENMVS